MTTSRRRPYRDSPVHDHSSETFAMLAICVVMAIIVVSWFADAIKVEARPIPTTRITANCVAMDRHHGLVPYSDC